MEKIMKHLLLLFSLISTLASASEAPHEKITLSAEDIKATAHSHVLKKFFAPELQKNLFTKENSHEFFLPNHTTPEDFKLLMAHLKRIENFKQGNLSNAAFDSYLQHASIKDIARTVALADFWEVPELLEKEPLLLQKLAARCGNKNAVSEYLSEKHPLSSQVQCYLAKKLSAQHMPMLTYWLLRGHQEVAGKTPSSIVRCKEHKKPVQSLAVSADGSLLASGSSSHTGIHLWNASSGKHLRKFENRDWSEQTVWKEPHYSNDGKVVRFEIFNYPEKVTRLSFAGNNELFAVSEADGNFEEIFSKNMLLPISGKTVDKPPHVKAYVNGYNTDNYVVADIYRANQVSTQKTRWIPKQNHSLPESYQTLSIAKDTRQRLIAVSRAYAPHPTVTSLSLNLARPCLHALFDARAQNVGYICDDNTLRVWQLATNNIRDIGVIASPLKHSYDIPGFAWNCDNTHILTVHDDLKARIWNSQDGTHAEFPNTKAAFFSHDGALLFTICAEQKDASINIWQVVNGRLILSLKSEKNISNALCMPDNASLAIADIEGTIKIIPLYDIQKAQTTINDLSFDQILLLLFGHSFNKETTQVSSNDAIYNRIASLPQGIRQVFMKTIWPHVYKEPKPLPNS